MCIITVMFIITYMYLVWGAYIIGGKIFTDHWQAYQSIFTTKSLTKESFIIVIYT